MLMINSVRINTRCLFCNSGKYSRSDVYWWRCDLASFLRSPRALDVPLRIRPSVSVVCNIQSTWQRHSGKFRRRGSTSWW